MTWYQRPVNCLRTNDLDVAFTAQEEYLEQQSNVAQFLKDYPMVNRWGLRRNVIKTNH